MHSSWVVLCVVIGAIPVAVRPGLGPFARYGSGAGVVAFARGSTIMASVLVLIRELSVYEHARGTLWQTLKSVRQASE